MCMSDLSQKQSVCYSVREESDYEVHPADWTRGFQRGQIHMNVKLSNILAHRLCGI